MHLAFSSSNNQSYYMEVIQEDILMEQKMRFGLVFGQWAIMKKNQANYNNVCGQFLHVFRGKKIFLKISKVL